MRLPGVLGVVALAGTACGGATPASQLATAPKFEAAGQTKCSVKASQAHPLVVEWPSSDRAALEAKARRALVAVHYAGCEMEVLDRCEAPGAYKYVPLTLKEDRVSIKNEDDLYANVPIGAARLERKLANAGELNVKMTIVGRMESDKLTVDAKDLKGDCAKATHVVMAMTVGAFDFYAGADAQVGAGASVMGAGGGATSKSQKETLNRDGDAASCQKSTPQDATAPFGCGALLRVEVAALQGMPAAPVAAVAAAETDAPMPLAKQPDKAETPSTPRPDGWRLVAYGEGGTYKFGVPFQGQGGIASGCGADVPWAVGGAVGGGVRKSVSSSFDLQSRLLVAFASGNGDGTIDCNSGSSPGNLSGSSATMFAGRLDATARWRPGAWFLGLGPTATFALVQASGSLTPANGSSSHVNSSTVNTSAAGAVLETGVTFGGADQIEAAARLMLLIDPNFTDGQAFMGLTAGYAFR